MSFVKLFLPKHVKLVIDSYSVLRLLRFVNFSNIVPLLRYVFHGRKTESGLFDAHYSGCVSRPEQFARFCVREQVTVNCVEKAFVEI